MYEDVGLAVGCSPRLYLFGDKTSHILILDIDKDKKKHSQILPLKAHTCRSPSSGAPRSHAFIVIDSTL